MWLEGWFWICLKIASLSFAVLSDWLIGWNVCQSLWNALSPYMIWFDLSAFFTVSAHFCLKQVDLLSYRLWFELVWTVWSSNLQVFLCVWSRPKTRLKEHVTSCTVGLPDSFLTKEIMCTFPKCETHVMHITQTVRSFVCWLHVWGLSRNWCN